jgi:uncharacterized membrane protein YdjX (TVP38/TMEM64 family)
MEIQKEIFIGRYRRLIIVVLFLVVVMAVSEMVGLREHFSLTLLRAKLADNQFTGLMLFVLLFALGNLIQIPGWIFLAAAVIALGRTAGGLATYVAACTSCAFTFFVIHFLGGDALGQIKSRTAAKLLDRLHTHPVLNIVVLRMLFQTLPVVNYVLALSGVGFRKYMLGTMLGLPVPIALYCLFFSQLAKAFRLY